MRPRFAMLAAVMTALVLAIPASALAAKPRHTPPRHNHGLTLAVAPNPIVTGDPVLIYGQLNRADHAGKTIVLWHKIAGHARFTVVGHTRTDANGFYSFTRKPGVVVTNRRWFTTAAPGRNTHSRTVSERVAAAVALNPSPATALTHHRVVFTGKVSPNHRGERVYLQAQDSANGNGWHTIDSARLRAGSAYRIVHRFNIAGDRTVRVLFRGDRRNTRAASDEASIAVSQAQNPGFTLSASQDPIKVGQAVTLSGALATPGNSSVAVTLYGRGYHGRYRALTTTTTSASGSYSFTQAPSHNTAYQVRTSSPANHRHTRQLFLGVHDVVSVEASSMSTQVGQPVTFSGTVAPSKVGHAIELQRLGRDGRWHLAAFGRVHAGSTYRLTQRFATPGTKQVRVVVPGGPVNQKGVSDTVSIAVSAAPVATLTPGF